MQSVDMSTGHFCCLLVSGMIILLINEAINHYLLRFLYYPLLAFSSFFLPSFLSSFSFSSVSFSFLSSLFAGHKRQKITSGQPTLAQKVYRKVGSATSGATLTRVPGRASASTGEDIVGVQPVDEIYGPPIQQIAQCGAWFGRDSNSGPPSGEKLVACKIPDFL